MKILTTVALLAVLAGVALAAGPASAADPWARAPQAVSSDTLLRFAEGRPETVCERQCRLRAAHCHTTARAKAEDKLAYDQNRDPARQVCADVSANCYKRCSPPDKG
ncbi:MAG: hypothetical protein RLT05_14630 [Bauldia litoralis]